MDLYRLIKEYEGRGYNIVDATAKVAQDIILIKISESHFDENITIKGILDRILHHAHIVTIKGKSYRLKSIYDQSNDQKGEI